MKVLIYRQSTCMDSHVEKQLSASMLRIQFIMIGILHCIILIVTLIPSKGKRKQKVIVYNTFYQPL